jgi:hypothetical protein
VDDGETEVITGDEPAEKKAVEVSASFKPAYDNGIDALSADEYIKVGGRQTGRQADRQTGRQADRQTGRQADRQTDRQAGREERDREESNRGERDRASGGGRMWYVCVYSVTCFCCTSMGVTEAHVHCVCSRRVFVVYSSYASNAYPSLPYPTPPPPHPTPPHPTPQIRLVPYVALFMSETPSLSKASQVVKSVVILLSVFSSILSTIDLIVLIPAVMALSGAATSWVSYLQTDLTILAKNSSINSMNKLIVWWDSLSLIEKRGGANKEMLVMMTESAIQGQVLGFSNNDAQSSSDDKKDEDEKKE